MITEHVYSNSFIDSAVNVSCSRLLNKRQTLNMLWLHFIYIKIQNLKKVSIGKQNESNPIFICILFSNASMLYKSILMLRIKYSLEMVILGEKCICLCEG